jgi:hypothetical protein
MKAIHVHSKAAPGQASLCRIFRRQTRVMGPNESPGQRNEYLQLMHRKPIGYLYKKYIVGWRIEQIFDIIGVGKISVRSGIGPSLGPYEE